MAATGAKEIQQSKLQDLKVSATEVGQYKDDAFLDRDDDGQYPRRNGIFFLEPCIIWIAIIWLCHSGLQCYVVNGMQ